jgi:hypothetical protein
VAICLGESVTLTVTSVESEINYARNVRSRMPASIDLARIAAALLAIPADQVRARINGCVMSGRP